MGQAAAVQAQDSVAARDVINQINSLDDPREAYRCVAKAIADCQAKGLKVPSELLSARDAVSLECRIQSQGR